MNINVFINLYFSNLEREKSKTLSPVPLLITNKNLLEQKDLNQKQTYCLGGRHMSNT